MGREAVLVSGEQVSTDTLAIIHIVPFLHVPTFFELTSQLARLDIHLIRLFAPFLHKQVDYDRIMNLRMKK